MAFARFPDMLRSRRMTSRTDAAGFYDQIASDYHLVYADWESAIQAQAAVLQRSLPMTANGVLPRILDCACGVGTQSIGLARLGYDVTGTDISPAAIRRAKHEATSRRLANLRFRVADMRHLPDAYRAYFDVVICGDNPLAHLLEPKDMTAAFGSMFDALRPGGRLIVTSRDYDRIVAERPSHAPIQRRVIRGRDTLYFQWWTWEGAQPIYSNDLYLLRRGRFFWRVVHGSTRMRAWTRNEIGTFAASAGFGGIAWKSPQETGFFQPMMISQRPVV